MKIIMKRNMNFGQKILLNNSAISIGSSSTIVSPTLSNNNPSIGVPIASSFALITSIAS